MCVPLCTSLSQRDRNTKLQKAEAHMKTQAPNGQEIKIVWADRIVTCHGVIGFRQNRDDSSGGFADLFISIGFD